MALEDMKADVAAKLPEWKAEYERLGKFIAAAEELVGDAEAVAGEGSEGEPRVYRQAPRTSSGALLVRTELSIKPDEFTGMSTSEAIRAYLTLAGKGNPKGPADMAKAFVLGGRATDVDKEYQNVASALKRMNKAKEVRQVRRGQWGLSSWYGGLLANLNLND